MNEIVGSKAVILGYGREGQSVHKYLHRNYPDIKIGIADFNQIKPLYRDSAYIHTGKTYLESLTNYDTIIRSPGIPLYLPRYKKNLHSRQHVTTATNIFFSRCQGMTIGVTGTKGKSTTSSLIYHLLKRKYTDVRLVGNIGNPAVDELETHSPHTYFVIELSSHQLEDCRYSPRVAVILLIVPEHFDHFPSFSRYVASKGHIVKYQSSDDWVIYNPTHQEAHRVAESSQAQKITFSMAHLPQSQCWVQGNDIYGRNVKGKVDAVIPISEIPLLGRGNIENTMAAITVAQHFGIPPTLIRMAIKKFRSLPHRLEKVGEYRGIVFFNDSLSTIPESTIHALEALSPQVATLIAGGMDRGLNYDVMGSYISKYPGLHTVILFPETGAAIRTAIKKNTPDENRRLTIHSVVNMKDAVKLAYQYTPRGKICLLSPAAASFNLFKDYQERGDQFKKYVKSLSIAPN